jgi:hypothetical protein
MEKPPKPSDPNANIGSELSLDPDNRLRAAPAAAPAKPKGPAPAKPLDEVERALSILDGRHPDAVRVERETQAVLAQKKAVADARLRSERAQMRRRWLLRTGAAALVAVPVVFGAMTYRKRVAHDDAVAARLGPAVAPFAARGFVPVETRAQESVSLAATEPTCFVALSSRDPGDGAVIVDRPGGRLDGEDSVAWCTCGAEQATAHVRDSAAATGGLMVLRTAAPMLGGPHGFAFLDLRPRLVAPAGADCASDALDAWVEKGAQVRAKDTALDEELRSALARSGFTPVGSALPSLPFAIVPVPADSCVLATSASPRDVLGLRLKGGARPLEGVKGPVGLCASHAMSVTVWRDGPGEVVALRVAAGRIGGTHGLREAMPRLGLPNVVTWLSDDDLEWDAAATLRSSGILAAEITGSTDGRPVKEARIVALSIAGATVLNDPPRAVAAASPAADKSYACDVPLSATIRSAVCVQSIELPWRTVGSTGKAGIAEAKLPFWMDGLAAVTEAKALEAEVLTMRLGRRLMADGFEPTIRDGVTEQGAGLVVHGRGGSDGLVAVQLSREAPWVSTCRGKTGDEWTLAGDPGVVSLAANAELELTCTPRAARDHRTVVFRRVAEKPPAH